MKKSPVPDCRAALDVMVLGGGPAGSVTAGLLARRGCSVVLLDRGAPPDRSGGAPMCIGETLPPQALGVLHRVGLREAFLAQSHHPAPGIVSIWGGDEPIAQDFLFSPQGSGWHLNRARFDGMLRDSAERDGAIAMERAIVRACSSDGAGWTVTAEVDGEAKTFRCRAIVDAMGRSASARLGFAGRCAADSLIALACLMPATKGRPASSYTLIEAVEEGWFYSALLPEGCYLVAFMTDADLYATGRERSPRHYAEQLAGAPYTRERIGDALPTLTAFSAVSSVRRRAATTGWLAVGDAARSYDPLSGLGIMTAIQMATQASATVAGMLDGDTEAAREYDEANGREYQRYMETRALYYAGEKRWRDSKFWFRRRPLIREHSGEYR